MSRSSIHGALALVMFVAAAVLAAEPSSSSGVPVDLLGASPTVDILDLPDSVVAALRDLPAGGSITLPSWPIAPGLRAHVALRQHDVYAPGARIVAHVGGAQVEVPRSSRRYFWGHGDAESARVLVWLDPETGKVGGLSSSRLGTFSLRPRGAAGGTHALDGPPVLEDGEPLRWGCGQEELTEPFAVSSLERDLIASSLSLPSMHTATIAVDTDNELMSQKFANNTAAATTYIANLIAAMNVMYERDLNVRLVQGHTILRVDADPYTVAASGGASGEQLMEFTTYWRNTYGAVERALAMMLSGKSPNTNQASGIAWLDVLCSTSYGYSFIQVFKINYLAGDASVVGHEIGHNFGSPHTHCYSPPIDCCYNGESGCNCGTTSCPAGGLGTIMSYCHLRSGCDSSMVFHPTTVAYLDPKMSARVGTCLFPLSVPDTEPPAIGVAAASPRIAVPGQPITIAATVIDNVAVASVHAVVRLGASEVASLPMSAAAGNGYGTTWSSTGAALGSYTVDIRAADAVPNVATAIAVASFELRAVFACDIVLSGQTVTDTQLHEACSSITAGPAFSVASTGDLTLRAGARVILGNGFSVVSGGRLVAGVDPTLVP